MIRIGPGESLSARSRPSGPTHESRAVLIALAAALPSLAVAVVLLWSADFELRTRITVLTVVAGALLAGLRMLHERVVRPWQTLANMLAALREGDYSLRVRPTGSGAMALAHMEANMLAQSLRAQRLGAVEAEALLRTVMEEIEVAIFAFDDADRLVLVNRAGAHLLNEETAELLGRSATDLDLEGGLREDSPRVMHHVFPGGAGRWETRLHPFRQDGRPHKLLVVADVSRALREEELLAWQRLVRVLSHEINNSLTPIKSIAGSLQEQLREEPRPEWTDSDIRDGLAIISGRADSLSRFMRSYARLAKLPPPELADVDVRHWISRVLALETRVPIRIEPAADVTIHADGDQLDQLLINLVHNAADASLETGGEVTLRWELDGDELRVLVIDDGPGLAPTANLFVPFFTTKPGGSGIGLVLSRQIAENHGGSMELRNRTERSGCVAELRLPIAARVPRRAQAHS